MANIFLNYTASVYQAKITELQAYYNQLSTRLSNLTKLEEQMFDFWNDDNAQTASRALQTAIHKVDRAMLQTNDMMIFYQGCVDELDRTGALTSAVLTAGLSVIVKSGPST